VAALAVAAFIGIRLLRRREAGRREIVEDADGASALPVAPTGRRSRKDSVIS
jgi:hypothetical protein